MIIQGRGDRDQWVTSFLISYSLNGKYWEYFCDAKIFLGNTDRATKVRINFKKAIFARALRIMPQSWRE